MDCLAISVESENAQLTRSEGRGGSPEKCGRMPTHRGMLGRRGLEQSDMVKAPNADPLEPGRKAGGAEREAIRKLCATCHVDKERAHFGGTQRGERATAEKKRRD